MPEVLQWVLRFAFGVVHGGTDAEILADGAAKVNMGQTLIMTSECCVEACESCHSIVFWIVYA